MSFVALVGMWPTRHECWDDAVQRVANATSTPRERVWFVSTGCGSFVFNSRPGNAQQPIGWIADPVMYQSLRSRGRLEDETALRHVAAKELDRFLLNNNQNPSNVDFSRAGASPPDPALNLPFDTMKKSQPEPTVYCILHPVFLWRGKRYVHGALLSITPHAKDPTRKEETKKLKHHVDSGAIRLATPEDIAQGGAPAAPEVKPVKAAKTEPEPAAEPYVDHGAFAQIDPREIAPSPVNPRRHFGDAAMQELTDSVREKGVRVAINVRPMPSGHWYVEPGKQGGKEGWFLYDRRRIRPATGSTGGQIYEHLPEEIFQHFFPTHRDAEAAKPKWEIIAGERRWRAARYAGCETIRAIVEDMADLEAAELQVIENDQRADLTPLESAAGYQYLLRQPGYDIKKLIARTGKSKSTIYERLKLLELPKVAQDDCIAGRAPMSTLQLIGSVDESLREEAAKRILGYKDRWGKERKRPDEVETYRDAEHTIAALKREAEGAAKHAECVAELKRKGYRVLEGKEAQKAAPYRSLAHNSGYIEGKEVCPRDPEGRTWHQVLKDAPGVERLAVVVHDYDGKVKGLLIFEREQANAALKKMGLWDAEGSEAAKEKLERQRQKAKQDRELARMNADFDLIVEKARGSETAQVRAGLAAALAVFTRYDTHATEFVCQRRKLETDSKRRGSQAESLRQLAAKGTLGDLVGLVAELSAATLGDSWNFRQEGRKLLLGLLKIEAAADSPDVRTKNEEAEMDVEEDEDLAEVSA